MNSNCEIRKFDLGSFTKMPQSPVGKLDRALVGAGIYPKPLTASDRREIAITEYLFGDFNLRELSPSQEVMILKLHALCIIAAKSLQRKHDMHLTATQIEISAQILDLILPGWQQDFPVLFSTTQLDQVRSVRLLPEVRQKLNKERVLAILNNTHTLGPTRRSCLETPDGEILAYNESLNERIVTTGLLRIYKRPPVLTATH